MRVLQALPGSIAQLQMRRADAPDFFTWRITCARACLHNACTQRLR
jgi:hypothetical protein